MIEPLNPPALLIQGLNVLYGQSHILRHVDLAVPHGACVSLIGRNGVGKTTLLKAIMGTLPIHSGTISFSGKRLDKAPPSERALLGIGYVPQGREIFPYLTVEENLMVGLLSKPRRERRIPTHVYDLFPVLWEMRGRRGGSLSGGQQQQLAFGRALALEPRLLILDEPTEGIQPNIVGLIAETLQFCNRKQGITVLLVEQKLAFARKVSQYFNIMEKGRLIASGPVAALNDELVQNSLAL